MKKNALSVFAAVAVMGLAQAKTVAWYHFDECEPGTMTKEEPTVYNSVDPSVGVGTPMYYWNGGKGTSTTHMPAYSNAFPKGRIWVDPRTGQKGSMNRCLYLDNPSIRGEWGNGEHGVVRIEDHDSFHLSTFTIECFVKDCYLGDPEHTEVDVRGTSHFVLCKQNSWGMSIPGGKGNGSRSLNGMICYDKSATATQWSSGVNANVLPRILRDGNWHHLAMVVDGSDPAAVKVTYYQDYCKLATSGTMPGPVYYDDSPIFLGRQDGQSGNGWNGLIDELRISDEALSPESFLHFANELADQDTVAYYSFDSWFGRPFEKSPAGSWRCNYFVNETPFVEPPIGTLLPREEATYPTLEPEAVGSMRSGLVSHGFVEDLGSLSPVTNGYQQGCGFTIDCQNPAQVFTLGDFTVEGFVKINSIPKDEDYVFRSPITKNGGGWSWFVTVLNDGNMRLNLNWKKHVDTSNQVLADLGWHHFAVVSTPATFTTRFYVDYRLIGTITDSEVFILSDPDTTAKVIWFSYAENGQNETAFSDGNASDVRIVKRALDPQEFLTVRPVASLVANVRFEGDYSVAPYGAPVPAGTVASGAAEIVERVPAKTVKDGTGATVVEENAKSVRLSGGVLDFGRNLPLEKADEMTVEFFLRPTSVAAEGAEIMKLATADSTVWSLTLSADRKSLTLKADTAQEAGQELVFEIASWQWWNHIALTFARNEGDTVVTCHQNGLPKTARTLGGTLMTDAPTTFTLGSAGFHGLIDELRVSPSVLPVERFMVCPDAPGLTLILK